MKEPRLSKAETRILEQYWKLGTASVREVLESLPEEERVAYTTVQTLVSGIDGDVLLRDAINAGRVPGPRILASARKITSLGSYVQSLNPVLTEPILQQEFHEVANLDDGRRAVDQNLFYNVDVIKVTFDEAGNRN